MEKFKLGEQVRFRVPKYKYRFTSGQVFTGEVEYIGLLTISVKFKYREKRYPFIFSVSEPYQHFTHKNELIDKEAVINKFKWNVNKQR